VFGQPTQPVAAQYLPVRCLEQGASHLRDLPSDSIFSA
jgi:hypothetical protein